MSAIAYYLLLPAVVLSTDEAGKLASDTVILAEQPPKVKIYPPEVPMIPAPEPGELLGEMPVAEPDPGSDYPLHVASPDAEVDYKLRIVE